MAATDSVESVNWPAAILDSQCRWTLGESLTHSQSDDRRSLNLDVEGLVSNKMHRLCRRDLEGALPLYNCYYGERTEENKHWQVRLKTERPCGLGIGREENWDFTGDDLKRTPFQSGQNKHDNNYYRGVRRYTSCKKPNVARGLRRVKTETDKEIVAINEARRRIKLRAMKEVRVKMGIKENCD